MSRRQRGILTMIVIVGALLCGWSLADASPDRVTGEWRVAFRNARTGQPWVYDAPTLAGCERVRADLLRGNPDPRAPRYTGVSLCTRVVKVEATIVVTAP